jgi:LPXTG-motif cell wall-anchored protein
MDDTTTLALVVAAAVGIVAILLILRRRRKTDEAATRENPYATSTEGVKRYPHCSMGKSLTETRCVSCGTKLPERARR